MELLTLKEKVLELFDTDIEGLGEALKTACLDHNEMTFDRFVELVGGDLSEDWMQKIFQYYLADRKEKKQDYTPKCLAQFWGCSQGARRRSLTFVPDQAPSSSSDGTRIKARSSGLMSSMGT